MRKFSTNATALAVGAFVLAGGAFAAGYVASTGASQANSVAVRASQAAPQRAPIATQRPVVRTRELAGQSLTAASANTVRLGSKVQTLWMNPGEFRPIGDPRACALANDGSYLYRSVGTCTAFIARVPLPEGAAIDSYTLVGLDNDASAEISLGMGAMGFYNGAFEGIDVVGSTTGTHVVHSGVEAAATQVRTFSGSLGNMPIDYYAAQGPASASTTIPMLVLNVPVSGNLGVFGVEVKWRRQYGPTPATAKFTDITPQHPYFTEIEMLGKAGISNGCGNNRYCADVPVTRGEMAVFLSRALGLYDETADNSFTP